MTKNRQEEGDMSDVDRHHSREPFPGPSPSFAAKKTKILEQLAVPGADYTDASPKGTVDEGIRQLIDEINVTEGFVTTSSCAGRVSVFLEGNKAASAGRASVSLEGNRAASAGRASVFLEGNTAASAEAEAETGERAAATSQVARVGGKGAGGTWLFVSHDAVGGEEWTRSLGFSGEGSEPCRSVGGRGRRWIHFKFEPMILHILTTSPAHAQALLQAALGAGFRESGALNLTSQAANSPPTPIVAVRSMGLAFESLIGYEAGGSRCALVTEPHLRTLMGIANERFVENANRTARFRAAFRHVILAVGGSSKVNPEGKQWEDAARRRERMREEGLRRREALRGTGLEREGGGERDGMDMEGGLSGLAL